jgi:hypothetical protein
VDEKKLGKMNDARLVNMADHLIYPLLKTMIELRLNTACAAFSGGSRDFVADIAYIQGLKELEQKLKRMQQEGNAVNAELEIEQNKQN